MTESPHEVETMEGQKPWQHGNDGVTTRRWKLWEGGNDRVTTKVETTGERKP